MIPSGSAILTPVPSRAQQNTQVINRIWYKMGLPHALPVVGDEVRFVAGISDMREILRNVGFTGDAARFRVGVVDALGRAHGVKDELRLRDAPSARSCYELAQEWLANAGNGRPTVNRTNRGIRILMQFFSQVHNTL